MKKRNMCKDCGVRYAQELGRCRQCWRKRIGDKDTSPFARKETTK